MNQFDWDKAKEVRTPRMYDFLMQNHDKPLTEDEYIQQVRLIKKLLRKQGAYSHMNSEKFSKKISGWKLRAEYRSLRKMGFFKISNV